MKKRLADLLRKLANKLHALSPPSNKTSLTVDLKCDASQFHSEMEKVEQTLKRVNPQLKQLAAHGVKTKAKKPKK